jgi:hypothetical protein
MPRRNTLTCLAQSTSYSRDISGSLTFGTLFAAGIPYEMTDQDEPRNSNHRKIAMTTNGRSARCVKLLGHTGALVFCAFWLVATSADRPPPIECYAGTSNPTTLQVTLGTPQPDDASATPSASCQGLDGLVPGGALTLSLTGPGPVENECFTYVTTSMTGVTDVTSTSSGGTFLGPDWAFTEVSGSFASSQLSGCTGTWHLALAPVSMPTAGQPISPLDAGQAQPWHLQRAIYMDHGDLCGGALTGPAICADVFPVASITQVAP